MTEGENMGYAEIRKRKKIESIVEENEIRRTNDKWKKLNKGEEEEGGKKRKQNKTDKMQKGIMFKICVFHSGAAGYDVETGDDSIPTFWR